MRSRRVQTRGGALSSLLTKALALLVLALLAGASLLSSSAHGSHRFEPECPDADDATTEACIAQRGDNDSEADLEGDLSGGDAVAGGQVIGGAGISGDVDITARNDSEFSRARGGDATAKIDLEVDSGPKLLIEGGDTNVEANATGTAVVTQTATPNVTINLQQFSNPSGEILISNTAAALTTLTGAAPVTQTAGSGSITQTVTQTGSSAVTSTVAPVLNLNGNNTANVSGSAPVTQSATVITNPTATATVGAITQTATISQRGDNDSEFELEIALAGGDAVAGGQVIGLAGVSGSVTIDASNQSRFATARGGESTLKLDADVDSGPRLTLGGGNTNVVANAEGVASANQTASPSVTLDVNQQSNPTGQIVVDNTVTATTDLGIDTQGTGGVTQTVTIDQTGSSSATGDVAPVLDIDGSNNATVTGTAPVNQTATVTTNPVAIATVG